jgi:MFS family permease
VRVRRPPALAGLWVSAAANSFARTAIQLALGWITLQLTGSPFMVGAVSAVRMAPQVPLGIPAGMLADWVDRRRLMVGVTAAGAGVALLLALLLAAQLGSSVLVLPIVLGAALAVGLLDTVRTSATQAYAYDLAPTAGAARGLAFVNLGAQLLGTLGGLVGGYTLERFGAPATFVLIAGVLAIGAALPALATPARKEAVPPPDVLEAPEVHATRPRPSLGAALTLVMRNRLVAALVVTIVVAEILGFSSNSVMPTFARDVFLVGAAGLGTMTAARSLGGVVGLAVLSRVGTRERSGAVMIGAATVLGVTLLAFAQTARFELALVWLVAIGAASSVLDTLGQTLLQQAVPARQRGAAMGTWVFAIGFGPVGHLGVGALAVGIGAPLTLTLFGAALAAFTVLAWRFAPLRSVR